MKYLIHEATRVRIKRDVVHYVREWRTYRGLSVEQLANKVSLSSSMISQLERGKSGYTQNTLEAIAVALECETWQLLACENPGDLADLWRIVMTLDRPLMQKVLREYDAERFEVLEKR